MPYTLEEPTHGLRFIVHLVDMGSGISQERRVLQQLWRSTEFDSDHQLIGTKSEWRDVQEIHE